MRYAELRATVAHLERSQCRCGRSTWSRLTKSIFGSFSKPASTLRSRKRSNHSAGMPSTGHGERVAELPHPAAGHAARIAELDVRRPLAELPDHSSLAELYGSNPTDRGDLGEPRDQIARFHEHNTPIWPGFAESEAQYPSQCLAALGHNTPSPFTPLPFSQSAQSSISSIHSSSITDSPSVVVPEKPMFTAHVTASPTEQSGGIASWHTNPSMPHQVLQGPSGIAAELSGSPVGLLVPDMAMIRLPEQTIGSLPELEGDTPRLRPLTPAVPRRTDPMASDVIPQQFWELPTVAETETDFTINGGNPPQTTGMERGATMAQPDGLPPLPLLGPPQPLGPQGRQYSFDSTAETIINNRADDSPTSSTFEFASYQGEGSFGVPQEQSPASTAVSTPVSSAPAASPTVARKRRGDDGQARDNNPLYCESCDYFPRGAEPRRMMGRHIKTEGHRMKTGQGPSERHRCPLCQATRTRRDNLREHIKDKHGEEALLQLLQGANWHRRPQPPPQQQQQQRGRNLRRKVQGAVSRRMGQARLALDPLRAQVAHWPFGPGSHTES
ncbi:hypothetical protein MYCTH_2301577 [Thermothelomyces thermophilus ATCC 42464]|uniref:Uncharacterized protein n=1 Tax=Thermothelomyces thermophilus (strain ATCC 42464 / BCRC 31852 / DSM 1799) TaxID=573729 RepID=G2Q9R3_THET4|nr:uncharacterized protein MYCTH_2301577 [Thermothelomyces thermophilus ATCC 42464]AEO56522.1 hypothetical protein MYCTH_2301577 [Thermothelomyces thermophilus ATCC 42464]